jgi:hypothetical protein
VGLSPEVRSALRTIGNASIGVGLGMSVLGGAFVVSQFAAGQGSVPLSRSTTDAPAASVIGLAATPTPPPPSPPTATAVPTSTPSPALTVPPPTSTPTPSPTPSQETMTVTAYVNGGKRYAALRASVDYVYLAPVAGTVRVQLYQLIDGEVRVGSNVTSLPFFPYVTLSSADRRIIFRPGALNDDTQMLIKDGERAEPGTPLFKTVGEGASSWRTFYDRGVTANVIASVAALPSGAELDPVAFFTTR